MKEPLFHIIKQEGLIWWKAWIIRAIAIIIAFLVCAIVTVSFTSLNPIQVFSALISGAVGTPRRIWMLLEGTAILLCIALALTPAFKMRFWNTGAEGQVLVGAMATATVMLFCTGKVPNWLLVILMLVSAFVAGAIWGLIPAIFKAKWNTNETLFTLMMNYVAIQVINYLVYQWAVPAGSGSIGIINMDNREGWLPALFGQNYFINVFIVIAVTVFMFIYLKFSKHGYEIAVVGESENTARYIGINVKKVIIRTMLLSGAFCGLAGFLIVAGADHTVTSETVGGQGFTAIMVSWLAKFNPVVMVFTAALIIFLNRGASEISTQFGLNKSFSEILIGIIILFIIGCEFFINYKIVFSKKRKEETK